MAFPAPRCCSLLPGLSAKGKILKALWKILKLPLGQAAWAWGAQAEQLGWVVLGHRPPGEQ